jgi:hypothetical protein
MEKYLGKEYANKAEREAFLKDNCEKVEEKGYMKPFTPEQLHEHKESLANVSIRIEEIEEEKKEQNKFFKEQLKPLTEERTLLVGNIKKKSEYVKEICYKFVDAEAKETGYYNSEGNLIECRPATADELQPTIFSIPRKTGTND